MPSLAERLAAANIAGVQAAPVDVARSRLEPAPGFPDAAIELRTPIEVLELLPASVRARLETAPLDTLLSFVQKIRACAQTGVRSIELVQGLGIPGLNGAAGYTLSVVALCQWVEVLIRNNDATARAMRADLVEKTLKLCVHAGGAPKFNGVSCSFTLVQHVGRSPKFVWEAVVLTALKTLKAEEYNEHTTFAGKAKEMRVVELLSFEAVLKVFGSAHALRLWRGSWAALVPIMSNPARISVVSNRALVDALRDEGKVFLSIDTPWQILILRSTTLLKMKQFQMMVELTSSAGIFHLVRKGATASELARARTCGNRDGCRVTVDWSRGT